MTIFALKGSLEEITPTQLSEQTCSAVFITDSAHAEETLRTANITYEGVISLRDVVFCKIESQPFCLAGTLSIPKLLDIKGSRHRIQFFIDNKNMVIIDDEEFSLRLVQRIQRSRHNQERAGSILSTIFSANLCSVTPSFLRNMSKSLWSLRKT